MFRYKLRTLLILLAVLPPLLAVGWWKYAEWRARREADEVFAQLLRDTLNRMRVARLRERD